MTTILRDVIQLYSDINFMDVSEVRTSFNVMAEVLRVEWWVSSTLNMETSRYSGKVGKILPGIRCHIPEYEIFQLISFVTKYISSLD